MSCAILSKCLQIVNITNVLDCVEGSIEFRNENYPYFQLLANISGSNFSSFEHCCSSIAFTWNDRGLSAWFNESIGYCEFFAEEVTTKVPYTVLLVVLATSTIFGGIAIYHYWNGSAPMAARSVDRLFNS